MKRTIIAFLMGTIFAGLAFAGINQANSIIRVGESEIMPNVDYQRIGKYYDENANVVCYRTASGNGSPALSCLKN
jgi:hypothetical protein